MGLTESSPVLEICEKQPILNGDAGQSVYIYALLSVDIKVNY